MQKVTVNGRAGHVTSALSTRNGKFNVWFEGEPKAEYIDAKDVVLIASTSINLDGLSDEQHQALLKPIPTNMFSN